MSKKNKSIFTQKKYLRPLASSSVGMILLLTIVFSQVQAGTFKHTSSSQSNHHNKHQRKQSNTTKVVVTKVAPTKSTSLPAPPQATSPPAAKTVIPPPPAAKPSNSRPVVVPSPHSNVSSLSPTSAPLPATPSSSTPSNSNPAPPAATTGYTSTNWSGYMAANGNFTAVSGSWKVPKVSGNGVSTSADAAWIGIGGVTSSDLIQIGTQNIVSAAGQVTTEAFYELLPNVSQQVPGMSVNPGDMMSANLTKISTNTWTMSITNNTNGQTYSSTVTYTSTLSSAEWIEEDPSYSSSQQIPFDNFGSVPFTSSSTVSNGVTENLITSNAQAITMVNSSGKPIATPSIILSDGQSFMVTQN